MKTLDQYVDRILAIVNNHWVIGDIRFQDISYPAIEAIYLKLELSAIEGSPVYIREYALVRAVFI
jgi:hypothetical protein